MRRKHSKEFKTGLLERVAAGETVRSVAHSVGVNESMLHRWRKSARTGQGRRRWSKKRSKKSVATRLVRPVQERSDLIIKIKALTRLVIEGRTAEAKLIELLRVKA